MSRRDANASALPADGTLLTARGVRSRTALLEAARRLFRDKGYACAADQHVPAERLVVAPDCGFKYLPRDVSFGKLQSMVRGRDLVRADLA